MDWLRTRGAQDEVPSAIMFADDVVLVDDNTNVSEGKLERQRQMDWKQTGVNGIFRVESYKRGRGKREWSHNSRV